MSSVVLATILRSVVETTIAGPAGAYLVHRTDGTVSGSASSARGHVWLDTCARMVRDMAADTIRGDAGRWVATWQSDAPTAEQLLTAANVGHTCRTPQAHCAVCDVGEAVDASRRVAK